MNKNEEMKMTHSGIVVKDKRRHVSVRFERGADVAEAVLPECKVIKSTGFSAEEVQGLENYLMQENDNIFARAKKLNNIKNWF